MTKNLPLYFVLVLVGFMALFGVVRAWTNPSAAPPTGGGPVPIANGGTAGTTASGARTNLGAAASGANSDITSITGLTTALTVAQGGTGATTLSGALIGNAASAFTAVAPGASGNVLTSNGTAWTSAAAATSPQTPWASNINAAGFTLFGNSTVSGTLTLDSTSNATKGNVLIAPSGGTVVVGGGSGKLDAGTVDPIYTIGGERFATYLPSMTGVKEETTGVLKLKIENSKLKIAEAVLDFKNAEKGSDLWLFYQITDFGKNWQNLSVIVSPGFDGRAWYKKEAHSGKLTVYGDKVGEVSYRLTAPRFDYQSWSNSAIGDENVQGFIVPTK
ncbi:MAG: hypothetical protein HYW37_01140 [Candidatus Colwellbacteria bacterium]|nr:hypothetical protein [Candidatus Colwellbacteria bacterium]